MAPKSIMDSESFTEANPNGWLRGAQFDSFLIFGVAGFALLAGLLVSVQPDWANVIIFLNLWFLGYHHVISTFTRLVFDTESFQRHKFLILYLPWLVFLCTLMLGMGIGLWAIASTYLYWQWWHYTRQSYGIFRAYTRNARPLLEYESRVNTWALYLLPLWGILYRSYQHSPRFLGMELEYFPTPWYVVVFVGSAAGVAILFWVAVQVKAFWQGRLSFGLMMYMLSHFTIFFIGYYAIDDITHGWLVLNVWHNAQYILFVWMANNKRFRNGPDPTHQFLSVLSQSRPLNILRYFAVCISLTTIIYLFLFYMTQLGPLSVFPLATILIYQTINFHHYIVDAIIWKKPKGTPTSPWRFLLKHSPNPVT